MKYHCKVASCNNYYAKLLRYLSLMRMRYRDLARVGLFYTITISLNKQNQFCYIVKEYYNYE